MSNCRHYVFLDNLCMDCKKVRLVYVSEWETVCDFGEGVPIDELLLALCKENVNE